MHDDFSSVGILTHYHNILRAKAKEQGVSMKVMLETVLRDTWPSEFKCVDEHNELLRMRIAIRVEERNRKLHGPIMNINMEDFIKAKILEREAAIAKQDAEEALANTSH
jgi:hypothetical protein